MPAENGSRQRRACDACHIRRTKCSGTDPCERCTISGLHCTRLKRPVKKGPAGKIIAEIKAAQLDRLNTALPVEAGLPSGNGSIMDLGAYFQMTGQSALGSVGNLGPTVAQQPSTFATICAPSPSINPIETFGVVSAPKLHGTLLTTGPQKDQVNRRSHEKTDFLLIVEPLLQSYLDVYFERFYPLCPIIDPGSVKARFRHRLHLEDKAFAALILSLTSLALVIPDNPAGSDERADAFIAHALELHNTAQLGVQPTLETIATSMSIAAFSRVRHGADAAYLRTKEAIGLAELLQLHRPRTYDTLSDIDRDLALNIFWILAVAERSTSLINMKPITFRTRITEVGSPTHHLSTFAQRLQPITTLFDQIEPNLVDCINMECSHAVNGSPCSFDMFCALATQQNLESVLPSQPLSDVQKADLELTKLWLQVKVWQVCISHTVLECFSPFPALRIDYPYAKVMETHRAIQTHSMAALEGNGRCMSLKLSCIADAATMVLELPNPPDRPDSTPSKQELQVAIQGIRALAQRLDGLRWIRYE